MVSPLTKTCDMCQRPVEPLLGFLAIELHGKRILGFCGVLWARNYFEDMCQERFGEVNHLDLPKHVASTRKAEQDGDGE